MSVRALTLNEIPEVQSVETVHLGPRDVIVVHVRKQLPPDEWHRINDLMRQAFPHNMTMLIPDYATLRVVRVSEGETLAVAT